MYSHITILMQTEQLCFPYAAYAVERNRTKRSVCSNVSYVSQHLNITAAWRGTQNQTHHQLSSHPPGRNMICYLSNGFKQHWFITSHHMCCLWYLSIPSQNLRHRRGELFGVEGWGMTILSIDVRNDIKMNYSFYQPSFHDLWYPIWYSKWEGWMGVDVNECVFYLFTFCIIRFPFLHRHWRRFVMWNLQEILESDFSSQVGILSKTWGRGRVGDWAEKIKHFSLFFG